MQNHKVIIDYLDELGSDIAADADSLAIILAAGHGKRIKSETSKMLHEIWGVPTVTRVSCAARLGLEDDNQIVVVGIKATSVADALGKNENRKYVFQAQQNGTGDAVRIALERWQNGSETTDVYVFPGDMGLLKAESVASFKADFHQNPCDMMVLTGIFEGESRDNYYGRILRVPSTDTEGNDAADDTGKVIEIKEHKDILAMSEREPYVVTYRGRSYEFTKEELIETREFNTGVYAFGGGPLRSYIGKIRTNNVQNELYLTDLIGLFNRKNLTVKASAATDNRGILGFNVKSVLKEMENYAREAVYRQLKDLITIVDKDDFFIADEVVARIVELDQKVAPLDIYIGRGVHVGKDVQLSKGVRIENQARLTGGVMLAECVRIRENVQISTYPGQVLQIGRDSEILSGNILKGTLVIGDACRIESSVNITGSEQYPTRIGNNVVIKGSSYIYGSTIEDDVRIEHSVIKCKHVERKVKKDGTVQPIRYVLPLPEGLDSIQELP